MNILIVIILLVFVAFIAWFVVKSTRTSKRIVKPLIYLYGVILIFSAVFYEFLPDKKGEEVQKIKIEGNLDRETMEIEQAMYDGRLDVIPSSMIFEEWEQPYEETQIRIRSNDGNLLVPVIIERKDENDGLIEGKYIASIIYFNLDFSEKFPPVSFDIDNQTLLLKNDNSMYQYQGVSYKKEFVIAQFTEERESINERSFGRNIRYVYLRVPKDMELTVDQDIMYNYTGDVSIEWHIEDEETEAE